MRRYLKFGHQWITQLGREFEEACGNVAQTLRAILRIGACWQRAVGISIAHRLALATVADTRSRWYRLIGDGVLLATPLLQRACARTCFGLAYKAVCQFVYKEKEKER